MSIRTMTDAEILAGEFHAATLPRTMLHARLGSYAREIVRLRDALREIEERVKNAKLVHGPNTAADCLEISARALKNVSR